MDSEKETSHSEHPQNKGHLEGILHRDREVLSMFHHFSSVISHALRNPLSGILMNAQMMEEELPEISPMRMYVQDIQEGAKMMEDTLRVLLEFSAPLEPAPSRFKLDEIVTEILHWFRRKTDPETVRIQVAYEPGLSPVYADPAQVRSILFHLFQNAFLAIPQGGEVQFRCKNNWQSCGQDKDMPFVEFEIQDSGCGIPKENLDKVFDPFFSTRPRRTGLGLNIVCALCAVNHGRLFLESKEGTGTIVRVLLPAAFSPQQQRSQEPALSRGQGFRTRG
jgi:signal transduction histidine kinase